MGSILMHYKLISSKQWCFDCLDHDWQTMRWSLLYWKIVWYREKGLNAIVCKKNVAVRETQWNLPWWLWILKRKKNISCVACKITFEKRNRREYKKHMLKHSNHYNIIICSATFVRRSLYITWQFIKWSAIAHLSVLRLFCDT